MLLLWLERGKVEFLGFGAGGEVAALWCLAVMVARNVGQSGRLSHACACTMSFGLLFWKGFVRLVQQCATQRFQKPERVNVFRQL
jgi:hypothetical protein